MSSLQEQVVHANDGDKVIPINLNRKMMGHELIEQIEDTAKRDGMLAGNALLQVINDMNHLRYLCEGLVSAYHQNDEDKVRKIIEIIGVVL